MAVNPDLIDDFVAITGAPAHVAEHVLEAHGGDMDAAVDFFLDSGGVGHGAGGVPLFGGDLDAAAPAVQPSPQRSPLAARQPPRSSPIEILDEEEEEDDGVEVLASSLGRRNSRRRSADRDAAEALEGGAAAEEVSLVDSDEEGRGPGMAVPRRVRRNRPRGAAEADATLAALGRRMGVAGPAPAPAPDPALDGDQSMHEFPPDVDLEEQRMLMAALTGAVYEGRVPDFAADPRYRQRDLSPGAVQREALRQEQDAAYHESLAADRRKSEAAERAEREAAEAAAAEQREAEQAAQAAAQAARVERQAAEARERLLRSKQAALPPEPPADGTDVVQLMAVFDFVDVAGEAEVEPGSYNLVSQFPRRVFHEGGGRTLAESDLAHKQEALFIELKD